MSTADGDEFYVLYCCSICHAQFGSKSVMQNHKEMCLKKKNEEIELKKPSNVAENASAESRPTPAVESTEMDTDMCFKITNICSMAPSSPPPNADIDGFEMECEEIEVERNSDVEESDGEAPPQPQMQKIILPARTVPASSDISHAVSQSSQTQTKIVTQNSIITSVTKETPTTQSQIVKKGQVTVTKVFPPKKVVQPAVPDNKSPKVIYVVPPTTVGTCASATQAVNTAASSTTVSRMCTVINSQGLTTLVPQSLIASSLNPVNKTPVLLQTKPSTTTGKLNPQVIVLPQKSTAQTVTSPASNTMLQLPKLQTGILSPASVVNMGQGGKGNFILIPIQTNASAATTVPVNTITPVNTTTTTLPVQTASSILTRLANPTSNNLLGIQATPIPAAQNIVTVFPQNVLNQTNGGVSNSSAGPMLNVINTCPTTVTAVVNAPMSALPSKVGGIPNQQPAQLLSLLPPTSTISTPTVGQPVSKMMTIKIPVQQSINANPVSKAVTQIVGSTSTAAPSTVPTNKFHVTMDAKGNLCLIPTEQKVTTARGITLTPPAVKLTTPASSQLVKSPMATASTSKVNTAQTAKTIPVLYAQSKSTPVPKSNPLSLFRPVRPVSVLKRKINDSAPVEKTLAEARKSPLGVHSLVSIQVGGEPISNKGSLNKNNNFNTAQAGCQTEIEEIILPTDPTKKMLLSTQGHGDNVIVKYPEPPRKKKKSPKKMLDDEVKHRISLEEENAGMRRSSRIRGKPQKSYVEDSDADEDDAEEDDAEEDDVAEDNTEEEAKMEIKIEDDTSGYGAFLSMVGIEADVEKEKPSIQTVTLTETQNSPTSDVETNQESEQQESEQKFKEAKAKPLAKRVKRLSEKEEDPDFCPSSSDNDEEWKAESEEDLSDEDDYKRLKIFAMKKKRNLKNLVTKERAEFNLDDHKEKFDVLDKTVGDGPEKKLYSCKVCDHQFKCLTAEKMSAHMLRHVSKTYHCPYCNHHDLTGKLVDHIAKEHGSQTPFPCETCGNGYMKKDLYQKHLRVAHGESLLKCKFCDSGFRLKNHLKKHLQKEHDGKGCYTCQTCNKIFLLELYYKAHIVQGDCTKKECLCQECGAVLQGQPMLNVHIRRVHQKERNYMCEHCSFTCFSKIQLQDHVRAHTGQHIHKCPLCDFTAAKSYQVTSHMKTHSGKKPFKCDQCNYASAWNIQLRTHRGAHYSRYMVMCDPCGIAFKDDRGLKLHNKKEHKNNSTTTDEPANGDNSDMKDDENTAEKDDELEEEKPNWDQDESTLDQDSVKSDSLHSKESTNVKSDDSHSSRSATPADTLSRDSTESYGNVNGAGSTVQDSKLSDEQSKDSSVPADDQSDGSDIDEEPPNLTDSSKPYIPPLLQQQLDNFDSDTNDYMKDEPPPLSPGIYS